MLLNSDHPLRCNVGWVGGLMGGRLCNRRCLSNGRETVTNDNRRERDVAAERDRHVDRDFDILEVHRPCRCLLLLLLLLMLPLLLQMQMRNDTPLVRRHIVERVLDALEIFHQRSHAWPTKWHRACYEADTGGEAAKHRPTHYQSKSKQMNSD